MSLIDGSLDATILALRLALTAVLYCFLVGVVLVARRDLRRQATAGSTAGRLLVVAAGATRLPSGHVLPLQAVTTIGRAAECTVPLPDTSFRRRTRY
jgi:hypothetical protein